VRSELVKFPSRLLIVVNVVARKKPNRKGEKQKIKNFSGKNQSREISGLRDYKSFYEYMHMHKSLYPSAVTAGWCR